MTGCQTCGGFGGHHDPVAHGTEQRTPHVCQFCETPLADHWWDPCTYTPNAPRKVIVLRMVYPDGTHTGDCEGCLWAQSETVR